MCDVCKNFGPWGRRDFLKTVLAGSLGLAAGGFGGAEESSAVASARTRSAMGVERIARLTPVGYRIGTAAADNARAWVQIDLGRSVGVESVKLFPVLGYGHPDSYDFPLRFRIDVSDDPAFGASVPVTDQTGGDYPQPNDLVAIFPASGAAGRYVRLTALQPRKKPVMLSKLEVWSGGKDVAEGCPATDSIRGSLGVIPLTRRPRPQGEGVVTDNPANVIPSSAWKPVPNRASAPLTGVTLGPGIFQTAMEHNITYLLESFSVDLLLRPFRERAGLPVPPGLPAPSRVWDTRLPGSNAGRFLMGAGNTVRWIDHPKLRERMNQVVDGIVACRTPNGFCMAYHEDEIFEHEHGAYTRSWVTHGLIDAGYAGHPAAFPLLRGFYDWFNACPYLPELLRRTGQGVQGQTPNTRLYFTPVGKPEDIQAVQRYLQENYWMDALARRDPAAIWRYPYDHPHNYLITALEPYLDQYLATGEAKYLAAAQGGWELYREHWLHAGGSVAICEYDDYPPDSFYLHRHTGELCGSAFWVKLNQRFQLLHPEEEKYAAEIERSIYNIILANQSGSHGFRYHAAMCGHKDAVTAKNTCCEGQGTRLVGSLPEYIYSQAEDGLYVNLFAASSIETRLAGAPFRLSMASNFPFDSAVVLTVATERPASARIRVRVPNWAAAAMPIRVNGSQIQLGQPGSYAVLDRVWASGDSISFELPIGFKLTPYRGMEPAGEGESFAVEYGPILMAAVGGDDERMTFTAHPEDVPRLIRPKAGPPLHFTIEGAPQHELMPYWQVADEAFTCYPVIRPKFPWS